jgi:hypothetical protein
MSTHLYNKRQQHKLEWFREHIFRLDKWRPQVFNCVSLASRKQSSSKFYHDSPKLSASAVFLSDTYAAA